MTTDQVRELERRMRARGLSRKAARDAVACVREWMTEHPADADDDGVALLEAAAQTLLRDISRGVERE